MFNLNDNQEKHCIKLLVNSAQNNITAHIQDMISFVEELYDESENGKATLKVPLTLIIKYDEDKGYSFDSDIDIKKVIRIKDRSGEVFYNPQIPDLPGFENGNMPEGKGDNGETFFFIKDWNCPIIDRDKEKEFEIDGWNNMSKPVPQGKLVNAIYKEGYLYRILRGVYDDKICYQLQKKKIEETTGADRIAAVSKAEGTTEEITSPDSQENDVPKGERCGKLHADGRRFCIKEKNHEGNHKYAIIETAPQETQETQETQEDQPADPQTDQQTEPKSPTKEEQQELSMAIEETTQATAQSPELTTRPLKHGIETGDLGKEFVFPDGVKVRAFDFKKLPENGKYFLNENDMLHNEKKTEAELLELKVEGNPIDYTVIRGEDKDGKTIKYYLCRKKAAAPKGETKE